VLIENLRTPAILVGNSMGAGAIFWAAAEAPEITKGRVFLGPFVRDSKAIKVANFQSVACLTSTSVERKNDD
jgi:pimeloyl-ACP methyl ester carboxylesterase